MIDLENLTAYRENNRLEAKAAQGRDGEGMIPLSVWETYSAFANTNGGIILLGVREVGVDKKLEPVGLNNPEKLLRDFWNAVNDRKKVSRNILTNNRVKIAEADGKKIIVIDVPQSPRSSKPIYLNDDFRNAYRRHGEGDYLCSVEHVQYMMSDGSPTTQDEKVLDDIALSALCAESLKSYRNRMKATKPDHVWEHLENEDFLIKIGAATPGEDGKPHPTGAGLLMFGYEYEIVREYPRYFLDYQETYDITARWTDRFVSSSGEWSGNVHDFYFKVYNKLIQNPNIKTPFKVENGLRVDDTPTHKALREALANCLINANYYERCGLIIKNKTDEIVLENPGNLRVPIADAISGGNSDPRNAILMKMFNLLDVGERSGRGIPMIYANWEHDQDCKPTLFERLEDFERVFFVLKFKSASDKTSDKSGTSDKTSDKSDASDKTSDKASDKSDASDKVNEDQAIYGGDKRENILGYMVPGKTYKNAEIAKVLALSPARTRVYLNKLVDEGKLDAHGENKGKVYRLK